MEKKSQDKQMKTEEEPAFTFPDSIIEEAEKVSETYSGIEKTGFFHGYLAQWREKEDELSAAQSEIARITEELKEYKDYDGLEVQHKVEWLHKRCQFTEHQEDYVYFMLHQEFKAISKLKQEKEELAIFVKEMRSAFNKYGYCDRGSLSGVLLKSVDDFLTKQQ